MSVAENKVLMNRLFYDTFNANNLAQLREICTPDVEVESPLFPTEEGRKDGMNAFIKLMTTYRHVHPDMVYVIEDVVAEPDKVAVGFSYTGTHSGSLPDIPASGQKVRVTGLCFVHVRDGKIARIRFCPYGPMPSVLSKHPHK